jgi:hypothetical protein
MTDELHELPVPCQSCKHKKYYGEMTDPCFPCLTGCLTLGNLSGEHLCRFKFSGWTDERLSYEEIERWEEEKYNKMQEIFQDLWNFEPEFKECLEKIFGKKEKIND